jgi:hypothetical protein
VKTVHLSLSLRWGIFRSSLLLRAVILLFFSSTALPASDYRGTQFIGIQDFSQFEKILTAPPPECVMVSPVIRAGMAWDELIPSWNLSSENAAMKVEVRGIYDDTSTPFYVLGLWSLATNLYPRKSVSQQKDRWGNVRTDTLILEKTCERLQIRLTFPKAKVADGLKFFGLCLSDSGYHPNPLPPSRSAWGKVIPVPERSQMAYPQGDELCSPTTLSMLLAFYAQELRRPDLDRSVPEIQAAVYDETWKGTGNWPFNTAYAGSLPGMRAFVTRFSDVSELEEWVASGLPIGLSVCYNKLRGRDGVPSGHLVVCVGFSKSGDPIINDPGTSRNVRKTFKRKNLITAWANSHNTVYVVYPVNAKLPNDRFGHWSTGNGLSLEQETPGRTDPAGLR